MNDDKFFKVIFGAWIAWAVVSLAVVGVAIWGVVELVKWVTSK